MNIIFEFLRWGTLYILVGVFIAAYFWEENFNINPSDHKLLAIGMLFGFGFLLNRWVAHHKTNFLVSQFYESHIDQEKSENCLGSNIPSEKIQ